MPDELRINLKFPLSKRNTKFTPSYNQSKSPPQVHSAKFDPNGSLTKRKITTQQLFALNPKLAEVQTVKNREISRMYLGLQKESQESENSRNQELNSNGKSSSITDSQGSSKVAQEIWTRAQRIQKLFNILVQEGKIPAKNPFQNEDIIDPAYLKKPLKAYHRKCSSQAGFIKKTNLLPSQTNENFSNPSSAVKSKFSPGNTNTNFSPIAGTPLMSLYKRGAHNMKISSFGSAIRSLKNSEVNSPVSLFSHSNNIEEIPEPEIFKSTSKILPELKGPLSINLSHHSQIVRAIVSSPKSQTNSKYSIHKKTLSCSSLESTKFGQMFAQRPARTEKVGPRKYSQVGFSNRPRILL